MTRAEFIDNVYDWPELLGFCYDNNCDECDEICHIDERDGHVIEVILPSITADVQDWRDVLRELQDIDDSCDYYIRNDYDEFISANEYEFQRYKRYVLEWMDENECWDDDEEEADIEEELFEEDFSVGELITFFEVID